MISVSSLLALLVALLSAVQANPTLPQGIRDSAISLATQVVAELPALTQPTGGTATDTSVITVPLVVPVSPTVTTTASTNPQPTAPADTAAPVVFSSGFGTYEAAQTVRVFTDEPIDASKTDVRFMHLSDGPGQPLVADSAALPVQFSMPIANQQRTPCGIAQVASCYQNDITITGSLAADGMPANSLPYIEIADAAGNYSRIVLH